MNKMLLINLSWVLKNKKVLWELIGNFFWIHVINSISTSYLPPLCDFIGFLIDTNK